MKAAFLVNRITPRTGYKVIDLIKAPVNEQGQFISSGIRIEVFADDEFFTQGGTYTLEFKAVKAKKGK